MNKINEKEALLKVKNICEEENYIFNGWCNKEGEKVDFTCVTKTNLNLHCNICGNDWYTTQCYRFINEHKRCPKCRDIKNGLKRLSNDEVVKNIIEEKCKCKGDTFLYFCNAKGGKIDYVGQNRTKLKIRCGRCGEEYIISYKNCINGSGCNKCGIEIIKEKQKMPSHIVMNNINYRCKENNCTFNGFCDKDGNLIEYKNNETYLMLHCNECDNEWRTTNYYSFVNKGVGCKVCYYNRLSKNKLLSENIAIERILTKCNEKGYSFISFCDKNGKEMKYCGCAETNLLLKCNKCNNEWFTTSYLNFIFENQGCPYCHSSKMETEIRILLNEHNIEFEEQKRFDWMGWQSLDFYLPKYNIGIECQGIQHFETNEHFGGKEGFLKCQKRDKNKLKLCDEHNIKMLYYANYEYDFPYNVINDKNKLIDEIKLENTSKDSIIL